MKCFLVLKPCSTLYDMILTISQFPKNINIFGCDTNMQVLNQDFLV